MSRPGRKNNKSTTAQVALLKIYVRYGHTGLVVEWMVNEFLGKDFITS